MLSNLYPKVSSALVAEFIFKDHVVKMNIYGLDFQVYKRNSGSGSGTKITSRIIPSPHVLFYLWSQQSLCLKRISLCIWDLNRNNII